MRFRATTLYKLKATKRSGKFGAKFVWASSPIACVDELYTC